MKADEIMVSVCVLVYNHEKFITQALEGILAQECNFRYEVIIGEDCSTDGSRKIVEKFAARYPEIIKPILQQQNVGARINCAQSLAACTGKYIAMCEGDDYWMVSNKLQMQVDFLEANPDYSLCFTDAIVVDENGSEIPTLFRTDDETVFGMKDILDADIVFIPTASMVFPNILPNPLPKFMAEAMSGDIAMHFFFADKGKIKKLNTKTSAYRVHSGGITKSAYQLEHAFNAQFGLYEAAHQYFNDKHATLFRPQLFKMSKTRLIYGTKSLMGMKRQKQILKYIRKYFKYADSINLKEVFYYLTILYFPFLLRKSKSK